MLLRFGGTMDTEKMFELADRLRALRDEKTEAEKHLNCLIYTTYEAN